MNIDISEQKCTDVVYGHTIAGTKYTDPRYILPVKTRTTYFKLFDFRRNNSFAASPFLYVVSQ